MTITRREQVCPNCDGVGWLDDPTACGDHDHCSPTVDCSWCDGTGRVLAMTNKRTWKKATA